MSDKTYTFHLVIHGPEGSTQEFEIPIGITTIGREADNDIPLNDSTISRHHAKLINVAGECELTDLNSSNGTFVNQKRLDPQIPVILKHQDRIGLGPRYELVILQIETVEEKDLEEAQQPVSFEEAPEPGEAPAAEEIPPPAPPVPPDVPETPEPPPDGAAEIPPGLSVESRFMLQYLPGIYHSERMSRFLALFESIMMPIEWTIDNFDLFLSPRSAPTAFLPWLANWFNAEFDNTWSESQKRQFLEEAWMIYARRGTKWALSRVLEIFTGKSPDIDDLSEDLRPHMFRVSVDFKEDSARRASIEKLIEAYKPAHTDYELNFKR